MNALVNSSHAACLEACQACLIDCQVCLAEMAGKKSINDCPYCCVQCIEVLRASIGLMASGSKFSAEQLCGARQTNLARLYNDIRGEAISLG